MTILTEKQRIQVCDNCHLNGCSIRIHGGLCDSHLEAQDAQSRLETLEWAFTITHDTTVYKAKLKAQIELKRLGIKEE